MLDRDRARVRFHEATSEWARSFSLASIKCLIVCRGPVRKEAIDVFDEVGIAEYGMLLSEKDSIVYPRCLAPEIRGFRFPENIHRVPDYMGAGQEEKAQRIREIVAIAKDHGYTHVFAGYGFMAEDAEFIEAIERAGLTFVGPSSYVARGAGAKDEAKKLARSLGNSVTPGVDNPSALALLARVKDREGLEALARAKSLEFSYDGSRSLEDNAEALLQLGYERAIELVTIEELQATARAQAEQIWKDHPKSRIRFKYIGGGGGKGQRVVSSDAEVAAAIMDILAESKVVAPGSNRNFLIELNIETTRHNEIQLIGNGEWCVSLGGRDCSVQMHEQKLLELSLTDELLAVELEATTDPTKRAVLEADRRTLARMEAESAAFGAAVKLNSVSTWEAIVEGEKHFFMEMNTRIQVEHRVTELAYRLKFTNPADPSDVFYVESLIEAMLLLSEHGPRVPKPERELRHVAGGEVRINATNAALQPHAGGMIRAWSPPLEGEIRDDQGIGLRNPDTGAFVFYNLAGAYDSNIALVVTHGESRRDNLERLAEILRRTELRGDDLQTNMPVHYGLIQWILGQDAMLKPSTRFMASYLAAVGSLAKVVADVDLQLAFEALVARLDREGQAVLRRKITLLTRPLQRLLASPHLLAGFLGRYDDVFWRRDGAKVTFIENPVVVLEALYHFLDLDETTAKPPSEKIWDHDHAILSDALAFYGVAAERLGTRDWPALSAALAADATPEGFDESLWAACRASHRGFSLGAELLAMLPRVGIEAGFFELRATETLDVEVPTRFTDPQLNAELVKALAPPPVASSNEIVTPMGGHFYAREAPHLPPLVDEGDHFDVGQPLFVIEVMKMFNKVVAPFSGTITKNLMRDADGKIVKKGQPIFLIEPDERLDTDDGDGEARRRALTLKLVGL
ncbi:MAG: biotin carboxylase [Myxococcales bacterium]|nr:biotin carboxylase [Myxococcales bacterium]